MQIFGMQKTTLVDFPGHVASTLFTAACNFRCPYCHNGDLVINTTTLEPYDNNEIFEHLRKRKAVLDGVVISGGEPTLHPDLPEFIRQIKDLGYLVKLDTNGSNPDTLKDLVEHNLIDYVAMDIKHSQDKYDTIANTKQFHLEDVEKSVTYLKDNHINYEFRTTLCEELHTKEDMESIGKWLTGAQAYYLQPYKESDQVLQPGFHAPSKEILLSYRELLLTYIEKVEIRGLD